MKEGTIVWMKHLGKWLVGCFANWLQAIQYQACIYMGMQGSCRISCCKKCVFQATCLSMTSTLMLHREHDFIMTFQAHPTNTLSYKMLGWEYQAVQVCFGTFQFIPFQSLWITAEGKLIRCTGTVFICFGDWMNSTKKKLGACNLTL